MTRAKRKTAKRTRSAASRKAITPQASAATAASARQAREAWRIHDEISQRLLAGVPSKGLASRPHGSRGRTVAEQFAHVIRVRLGWLYYQEKGARPSAADLPETRLDRASLRSALRRSARAVDAFLAERIEKGRRIREFRGNPLRFLGYLIAHESHHRGSILLALKQENVRVTEKVKYEMWTRWMSGA